MAGPYFYSGQLLFVGGQLAMHEDCCCFVYETCCDCVESGDFTGIKVTVSGLPDTSGCPPGGGIGSTWYLANLNGVYNLTTLLTSETCLRSFGLDLGTAEDCGDRGVLYRVITTAGGSTFNEYLYRLVAAIDCVDGQLRLGFGGDVQSFNVTDGGCTFVGTSAMSYGAEAYQTAGNAWEDFCNGEEICDTEVYGAAFDPCGVGFTQTTCWDLIR